MEFSLALKVIISLALILTTHQAKKIDPYKVLGVDHEAGQREIQKAFHKLSLQYHPDKNKNKGAQEKFAEINNAYEILGDEEKRKNYDTFGDENGHPGFHGGDGGHTFTGGSWGSNGHSFSNGKSHSFSFSFGGPSSGMPFDFGANDFFNMFGGSGGHSSSESSYHSNVRPKIKDIKSDAFLKEATEEGITYIILSYLPSSRGIESYETIIDEASESLKGALKARKINCENDALFCKQHDIHPRKYPRIFIFSYRVDEEGSMVEYKGDLVMKDLKSFCQDYLPRFSKRMDITNIESLPRKELLPGVLLLSSKKDTPVIWRVLSGLHHKRFSFYDTQVNDMSDESLKGLGVGALPAVVGWTVAGERHVLVSGIPGKDLKNTVEDLGTALDELERKNKQTGNSVGRVSTLTKWNMERHCGEGTPVCVIGVYRSERSKEKLWFIAWQVAQMSLGRHVGGRDSVAYALLNGAKHQTFLDAFEKSGFRKMDELVLAFKPRTSKYAVFQGDISMEEVETFIASLLNGDLKFTKTTQIPSFK